MRSDPDLARPPFLTSRLGVVALAVLALAEGAVIARLITAPRAAPATVPSVAVTIESSAVGDVVTVDGREVGVTPYRLKVDSSVRSIGLVSPPRSQAADVGSAAAPSDTAGAKAGGLSLSSPIELQVLEGERVLGSSADGPIVATAGVHQLDLVNSVLGYHERRTVEIAAGEIRAISVKPPDGRLNISAVPPAQVWIDGRQTGETPLENVALPVGQHEIVFRHPQWGEHRETAIVKSGALTRVSVTLSR